MSAIQPDQLKAAADRLHRKIVILRLRQHLAFFGIDTHGMSDDDLVERMKRVQENLREASRQMGITTNRAAQNLLKFGEAMRKADIVPASRAKSW